MRVWTLSRSSLSITFGSAPFTSRAASLRETV